MDDRIDATRDFAVLYMLGYARSGTTLLGNILGEMDDWFHAGEITYLWAPGLNAPRRRCGCGVPIHACELWRAIFAAAFPEDRPPSDLHGTTDDVDPLAYPTIGHTLAPQVASRMMLLRRQLVRWRSAAGLLLRHGQPHPSVLEYRATTARLYAAIAAVTGAKVVVDSSKLVTDAVLASGISSVDLRFVHLVRDGRGVTLSRLRGLASRQQDEYKVRLPLAVREGSSWAIENLVAEMFAARTGRPNHRIRYEDLVRRPEEVVRQTSKLIAQEPTELPWLRATPDGAEVILGVNHTTSGNRNRWRTGVVPIREDRAWSADLAARHRMIITAASWPGLARYGYLRRPTVG